MINVLDLFSGIGGFSLGLERTGYFKTSVFCEAMPIQSKILKKHWPNITVIPNIKYITKKEYDIDLICGGFPCQAFSTAASGQNYYNKNLWPEMLNVIKIYRPKWIIAENVSKKAILKAKYDLEGLNYAIWTRNISAASIGADHKRNRWWLCAHSNNESKFFSSINAEVAKLPKLCESVWGPENYSRAIRVSNGISYRMDRIIALGNSVIPYIPQAIGNGIKKYLTAA